MGLPDAAAVFTTVGKILGHCCTRIPDGETGARGYWIRWQEKSFKDNPDIEPKRPAELKGFKDTLEHPFYGARAGVDPGGVDAGTLGYADHAIESFALFSGLERQGKIPPGLRFQVSLPTPVALLGGFVVIRDRAGLEPALERALLRDLDRLQDEIPHSRLAIQWDVCHEVLGADQGPPLHYEEAIQGSAQRLGRLCGQVAENVELEIHLCYGDPGHKHIVEPKDLEVAVGFANGICDLSPRRVDYIHMPVPPGSGRRSLLQTAREIRSSIGHAACTRTGPLHGWRRWHAKSDGGRGSIHEGLRYRYRVWVRPAGSGNNSGASSHPQRTLRGG